MLTKINPLFQKRHYRQRAHANPFSDHTLTYPSNPGEFDLTMHYPTCASSGKVPEFADIGCGFGGLLVALAPLFPNTLMLGELRCLQFRYFVLTAACRVVYLARH